MTTLRCVISQKSVEFIYFRGGSLKCVGVQYEYGRGKKGGERKIVKMDN
jgi:hypothetical protein